MLLLHTVGAPSGRERINALMYQDLGDGRVAVFASANGAPNHPDWYHNLVANSIVSVEIGTETRQFRAHTAADLDSTKARLTGLRRFRDKHRPANPVVVLEAI